MSTIKSSNEHLTFNADGTSKEIRFQANGTQKASISSAGLFTSTTIDATKLTGTIPSFRSTGIDDNADATAITIDSSERIGIGTASPSRNLQVQSTGSTIVSINSGNTSESQLHFADTDDDNIGRIAYDHSTNAMEFWSNDAERMRIDSSGTVLINGTTSPTVRTGGNNSTGDCVITAPALGDNALTLKAPISHAAGVGVDIVGLNFAANNYYGGSGKSGIYYQIMCENGNGSYSDRGQLRFTPGYDGNIQSGQLGKSIIFSYDGDMFMYDFDDSGGSKGIRTDDNCRIKFSNSGSSTQEHLRFYNSNGLVGQIHTNGSSTTFQTSSDYRLKENVDYTWDATTRLKQLKPARFNFIADDTNTLVDGFIAHEVSSVVPEAINGEKDAMTTDENGDAVIDPQGIDQSKLVPLLVKTIQELEARITAGGL